MFERRIMKIFLAIIIMFALTTFANAQDGAQLVGLWGSTLPCSEIDCESIAYKLYIKKNKEYREHLTYKKKKAKTVKTTGKWDLTDGILTLYNERGTITKYRPEINKLIPLTPDGEVIRLYEITKLSNNFNEIDGTDIWQKERAKGIDFVGMGNEPFWNVKIDLIGTMSISRLGEKDIEFSNVKESLIMDSPGVTYTGVTPQAELKVDILKIDCTDNMSGEIFPYTVKVNIKLSNGTKVTQYRGCGKYLADYRLNGSWAMEKINNKDIDSSALNSKKPPVINISVGDEIFSGTAGCNDFTGHFEPDDNKLIFKNIVSTRMYCDDMALENEFLGVISNNTFMYLFEGNKLKLINMSGVTVLELGKSQ